MLLIINDSAINGKELFTAKSDNSLYKVISYFVWDLVSDWNNFAKYTIGQQFVDAVDSISANIAEGFGRYHKKDKVKFYYYSFGSVKECLDWNEKAKVRKLIDEYTYSKIFATLDSLPKEIHQLIKFTNERLKI